LTCSGHQDAMFASRLVSNVVYYRFQLVQKSWYAKEGSPDGAQMLPIDIISLGGLADYRGCIVAETGTQKQSMCEAMLQGIPLLEHISRHDRRNA
jgi:hypothetical protein